MEIDRIDIATRLIEERGRVGFSQKDFARQLDISREGLRLYEMGQRSINAEFLAKAAGLGVDVQYVLTGIRSQNNDRATQAASPITHIGSGASGNVFSIHTATGVQVGNNNTTNHNTTNINTDRHITKTVVQSNPGKEHISESQKATLKELVNKVEELEQKFRRTPASYRSIYASLNSHCGVTSYSLIPLEKYEKAEKYLRQWIGRLSSQKRAGADDEVRKRKYAYIKINTQSDESWLRTYLANRFNATSLTELDDDQLLKTYRAVASRKQKNR